MAQSEFRVGPQGQKQRLNQNRRWENVDSNDTQKASSHSPNASRQAASSDFGNAPAQGADMTPEEKDAKQLETSTDFVEYLLDEGYSPYDVINGHHSDSLDDTIAEYIEYKGAPESDYDHIIDELESHDNDFSRAYGKIMDDATKFEKATMDRLMSSAYKEADNPVAVLESDPDLYPQWLDQMFDGTYNDTYENFYNTEVYSFNDDMRDMQKDNVDMLIEEWTGRARQNGIESNYLVVSSDDTTWRNRSVEGVIEYDAFKEESDQPFFIPNDGQNRYEWVQNEDGETLTIISYHHDSPTGESWNVRPLSNAEAKERLGDDYDEAYDM